MYSERRGQEEGFTQYGDVVGAYLFADDSRSFARSAM